MTVDLEQVSGDTPDADVLALHDALDRLAQVEPRIVASSHSATSAAGHCVKRPATWASPHAPPIHGGPTRGPGWQPI